MDFRAFVPLFLDGGEDLLLPCLVVAKAKGHELLKRDFVVLVSLEEQGARIREAKALFHDGGADIESGGNCFFAFAFVGECLEGAELIERMQRFALGVLGKAVGFDEAFGAHDARNGRVFCELLLFDEKLQRAQAAAASLYAVGAGFFAGVVQDRADAQGLKKPAAFDVGGKRLDRNACLDLADIAVMDGELVERNGLWRGERKFLGGFGHRRMLHGLRFRGLAARILSRAPPLHPSPFKPLPLTLCRRPEFGVAHGLPTCAEKTQCWISYVTRVPALEADGITD